MSCHFPRLLIEPLLVLKRLSFGGPVLTLPLGLYPAPFFSGIYLSFTPQFSQYILSFHLVNGASIGTTSLQLSHVLKTSSKVLGLVRLRRFLRGCNGFHVFIMPSMVLLQSTISANPYHYLCLHVCLALIRPERSQL